MPGEYHFWDMDHTLIDNDCDVSWKEFLVAEGLAPVTDLDEAAAFFQQYRENRLDWRAFMAFQLRELAGQTPAELAALAERHFVKIVQPRLYPRAVALVHEQLARGATVCLLTATNRAVALPLAKFVGIPHLLATELELLEGRYTGRMAGEYCGGRGKVPRLLAFCQEHGVPAAEVWYYGDSSADLPALEAVGHPVVANPMPALRAIAEQRGWPLLDFRG